MTKISWALDFLPQEHLQFRTTLAGTCFPRSHTFGDKVDFGLGT